MISEITNMNTFSFDFDIIGSIPGKCKYTYK